jgi:glycosyltransferase involved in cell wall biosynthesis
VEYFCKEIFPAIQSKFPDAEFVIAGQRPVSRVLALANDKITVTGFVNDIAEEYAKAGIVVAPLRFGAGTQNKVLEALSMGVPVICTHVGFKGLGLQNGEGIVLAADTQAFIAEINRLLENEDERNRLAGKGMEKIRSTFGWNAIAIKLIHYLKDLTQ